MRRDQIIEVVALAVARGKSYRAVGCPGGCIDGAGNPAPAKVGELRERTEVLFDIDRTSTYRRSQDNPDILRLYEDFYDEPNSERAHHLLHTTYAPFAQEAAPPVLPVN